MSAYSPINGEIRGDFHTHTTYGSDDGGLSAGHIRAELDSPGGLSFVAITDHNTIAPETFALAREYAGHIIVGEEIKTKSGSEVIGLYLKEVIQKGLPALETVKQIYEQDGIPYIPHPFLPNRHGMSWQELTELYEALREERGKVEMVVERYNSRAWTLRSTREADLWASIFQVPTAVGSDAHGPKGWGKAYTVLDGYPDRATFTSLLNQHHNGGQRRAGVAGRIQPASNKVGKRLGWQRAQTANWQ